MTIEYDNNDTAGSKPNTFSVLICDQDEVSRQLINEYLSGNGRLRFQIREAAKIEDIEKALAESTPEAIILALNLQGKSMMEWLDEFNSKNVAPTVVLAAEGDELIAVESMKRGAFDYIPKSALTKDMLTRSLIYVRDRWNHLKAIEDERVELERMAMFDSLTDLLSRRALMEQIDIEMVRSRRYGHTLSILMIDIDLFKRINDTHGHVVGDRVIKAITQSIRENVRRSDVAGRYGGEEFVVMLPETPIEKSIKLAEKLRSSVANLKIKSDGDIVHDVTVSIGIATYRNGESMTDLIDRSDKGLYMAKKSGRNKVARID